ncbi:MAG: tetratricopeptide repeat protein [Candidatus Omnitrophica bacterium]|nr:tetratricopeptide repeat protein [Candidatus Omnitrophota bacterium]
MNDRTSKQYLFLFIFLSIVICLVYACTIYFQFVIDDECFIVDNCYIKNINLMPRIFSSDPFIFAKSGLSGYYRPIQIISYAVDYSFYGLDPTGYHITNIFLFCICSFLLFLFLNELFNNKEIAYVVSLLFSVNPFLVADVAYVSGRGDLFVFLFLFSGLYCAAKLFKGKGEKYGTFSILACFLALFAKESAVFFPFYALIVYFSVRSNIERKKAITFFICLFAITGFFLLNRVLYHADFASRVQLVSVHGFYETLMETVRVFWEYLKILIFPKDLYFFRILPKLHQISLMNSSLFFLGIFSLFLGVYFSFIKKNKVILFLLLWLIVSYLPFFRYIDLFPKEGIGMLEHWFGLTSISFFIMIVYSVYCCFENKRILRLLIWGGVILYYAFFVSYNIDMWQNDEKLLKKIEEFYKKTNTVSTLAFNNMGVIALKNKDLEEADKIFSQLINSGKIHGYIIENMVIVLCEKGEYEKAENLLKSFTMVDEYSYYRLGQVYFAQGKIKKAYECFMETIDLRPENVEAWLMLGQIFYLSKDNESALKCYQKGGGLDPDYPHIDHMLSNAYLLNNDTEKAVYFFLKEYEKYPNDKNTYDIYKQIKEKTKVKVF